MICIEDKCQQGPCEPTTINIFFFREGLKEAKNIFEEYFDAHFCHQTPSFERCAETDRSKFNLILYNSHAQPFSGYVNLPLTDYFELR